MEKTTDFGFATVPQKEKAGRVRAVFSAVASRYDLMNDVMSLGLHRLWKHHFVATAGLRPGQRILDLAGGSGDIARLAADAVGPDGLVVLSDINPSMLAQGRDRMLDEGLGARMNAPVQCALIDAQALPFPDRSFDLVTIAFGLRNVTDKALALKEMLRVLKLGGRVTVLEFSEPTIGALKPIYDAYSFHVLPRLGEFIANDRASYQYLVESIRRHPNQEALKQIMQDVGFAQLSVHNLMGGIVAIHSGYSV
jgi:demethylmenaquinone methyltransferase / 2-methoxy-6-polyprenyl-1,4-benzoquinol methylase